MCGIVGYIGDRMATEVLVEGLRRLEYRGYDSAGVAVRQNGSIVVKRSVGKLKNLELALSDDYPKGHTGIGHTRWATHGRPAENNAHPHRAGKIILVHNGIIENHNELRDELKNNGHSFDSETDTEIACHLFSDYSQKYGTAKGIKKALKRIEGSYAFVIMNEDEPEEIYIARKASPLVVGVGDGEMIIASDITAVLSYTKNIMCLEDGDFGVVRKKEILIEDDKGSVVERKITEIKWDHVMAEKGGYKHFMLKEIFEQPKVIADTMAGRVISSKRSIELPELDAIWGKIGDKFEYNSIYIIACGTSWHAAKISRYWIERICRVPVSVELASEFRYRDPILNEKTLVVSISQSGETADTLAAVQLSRKNNAKIISICNVLDSSIPRISDASLYTHAGPEIGVASTKAFTAQLVVLLMFTMVLGRRLGHVSDEFIKNRVEELLRLPSFMKEVLSDHEKIREIAEKYVSAPQVLFIGRGIHYPLVLEGALKLKEISYMHAEGFAAGELKHGPIALVDHGVPVVAVVAHDEIYDKIMSNIEEVQARGGDVIALAAYGDKRISEKANEVIYIPESSSFISPILYALPLQLFAYYMADYKGTDVDQPRNLAKSVTVE